MATRFDVKRERSAAGKATGDASPLAGLQTWRRAARVAIGLALVLGLSSCVRVYTADPIKARVVDSVTGAPVEGVNVLAAWQARGGLEGGNIVGYVKVMEDVTNANGEFAFPGWGPMPWMSGAIRDGAPLLILLKPGYEVSLVWEDRYGVEFAPSHLSSSWNDKNITLKKFVRPEDEYAQRLSGLRTVLDTLIGRKDCNWRSIPRFLYVVDRQHQVFLRHGSNFGLEGLDTMEIRAAASCGSMRAFVMEHGR
jgi:hypothetical protein